jgi:hypothetical protein
VKGHEWGITLGVLVLSSSDTTSTEVKLEFCPELIVESTDWRFGSTRGDG